MTFIIDPPSASVWRALVAAFAFGCSGGQTLDLGEDDPLRIENATFFRSPLPEGQADVEVSSATVTSRVFPQGSQQKGLQGTLSAGAVAVALALGPQNGLNSTGYWLLPAGPPFVESPDAPSFATALSFAEAVVPGPYVLTLSAIDGLGDAGRPRELQFLVKDRPMVDGQLVFSLDWSHDADLDIHVVTPNGDEIFRNDVRDALDEQAGALDFDSNGDCRIDGRRNENVVWLDPPPSGRYVVRVDTFSLCREQRSYWRVSALYKGKLVAATAGVSLPTDTRGEHGRGAGLTAMELRFD